MLDEFIIESNKLSTLPDGVLVALNNLKTINLSRNLLAAFPQGGAKQFETVVVSFKRQNTRIFAAIRKFRV